VEERHAAKRRGILQGGAAYGCCFTGGADNNFFTFASLTRPSGRGLLSAASPYVVLAWVLAKNLALTAYELARALPRWRRGRRWLWLKIGVSIWIRNFFTLAVGRNLYEGTPRIYVNYLDYDEAAHASGPRSRRALQALREIDRALEQLWRVMRRVPEHRYDGFILADHGQSPCTPYRALTRGRRLERWIFDAILHPAGAGVPEAAGARLGRGIRERRRASRALLQKFMNYLDEDYFRRRDPEAHEHGGVRAIAAGPNAFLYVLDAPEPLDAAAIERRFPGLPEKLSRSRGIGFVLARSGDGKAPLCYRHGHRWPLSCAAPGPFGGRADSALVVEGLTALMSMPSAGDLVIYGEDATGGTVSFLVEHGAHAGPSAAEMRTFIIGPPDVNLPAGVVHPAQLYDYFMRYQLGARPLKASRQPPSVRPGSARPSSGFLPASTEKIRARRKATLAA
jgi:hypothetical protein